MEEEDEILQERYRRHPVVKQPPADSKSWTVAFRARHGFLEEKPAKPKERR